METRARKRGGGRRRWKRDAGRLMLRACLVFESVAIFYFHFIFNELKYRLNANKVVVFNKARYFTAARISVRARAASSFQVRDDIERLAVRSFLHHFSFCSHSLFFFQILLADATVVELHVHRIPAAAGFVRTVANVRSLEVKPIFFHFLRESFFFLVQLLSLRVSLAS